jgi:hypothetical protein
MNTYIEQNFHPCEVDIVNSDLFCCGESFLPLLDQTLLLFTPGFFPQQAKPPPINPTLRIGASGRDLRQPARMSIGIHLRDTFHAKNLAWPPIDSPHAR